MAYVCVIILDKRRPPEVSKEEKVTLGVQIWKCVWGNLITWNNRNCLRLRRFSYQSDSMDTGYAGKFYIPVSLPF